MASAAVVTPFVLSACYGGPPCTVQDNDGDGFENCVNGWDPFEEDCDDENASVNPDAEEVCDDGIDNNCDGVASDTSNVEVCGNNIDDDCDGEIDELATEPGTETECTNGLDDDCDGVADGDDPDCGGTTGDGFGSIALSYTFDANFEVPTLTCADAGLTTLSVTATGPETIEPFSIACDDTAVTLSELAVGSWTVQVSGEVGIVEYSSGAVVVAVTADETTSQAIVLTCSSEADDGCGGA